MNIVLFNAMRQPIVIADDQLCITFVNTACSDVFGWTRDELMGHKVEILMQSEFAKQHCEIVRKYQLGLGAGIIGHTGRQVVGQHKNGSAVHLFLSIVDSGDGSFVASFVDLSAKVEHDLLLQETTRQKTEMVYVELLKSLAFISHEVNI